MVAINGGSLTEGAAGISMSSSVYESMTHYYLSRFSSYCSLSYSYCS